MLAQTRTTSGAGNEKGLGWALTLPSTTADWSIIYECVLNDPGPSNGHILFAVEGNNGGDDWAIRVEWQNFGPNYGFLTSEIKTEPGGSIRSNDILDTYNGATKAFIPAGTRLVCAIIHNSVTNKITFTAVSDLAPGVIITKTETVTANLTSWAGYSPKIILGSTAVSDQAASTRKGLIGIHGPLVMVKSTIANTVVQDIYNNKYTSWPAWLEQEEGLDVAIAVNHGADRSRLDPDTYGTLVFCEGLYDQDTRPAPDLGAGTGDWSVLFPWPADSSQNGGSTILAGIDYQMYAVAGLAGTAVTPATGTGTGLTAFKNALEGSPTTKNLIISTGNSRAVRLGDGSNHSNNLAGTEQYGAHFGEALYRADPSVIGVGLGISLANDMEFGQFDNYINGSAVPYESAVGVLKNITTANDGRRRFGLVANATNIYPGLPFYADGDLQEFCCWADISGMTSPRLAALAVRLPVSGTGPTMDGAYSVNENSSPINTSGTNVSGTTGVIQPLTTGVVSHTIGGTDTINVGSAPYHVILRDSGGVLFAQLSVGMMVAHEKVGGAAKVNYDLNQIQAISHGGGSTTITFGRPAEDDVQSDGSPITIVDDQDWPFRTAPVTSDILHFFNIADALTWIEIDASAAVQDNAGIRFVTCSAATGPPIMVPALFVWDEAASGNVYMPVGQGGLGFHQQFENWPKGYIEALADLLRTNFDNVVILTRPGTQDTDSEAGLRVLWRAWGVTSGDSDALACGEYPFINSSTTAFSNAAAWGTYSTDINLIAAEQTNIAVFNLNDIMGDGFHRFAAGFMQDNSHDSGRAMDYLSQNNFITRLTAAIVPSAPGLSVGAIYKRFPQLKQKR